MTQYGDEARQPAAYREDRTDYSAENKGDHIALLLTRAVPAAAAIEQACNEDHQATE